MFVYVLCVCVYVCVCVCVCVCECVCVCVFGGAAATLYITTSTYTSVLQVSQAPHQANISHMEVFDTHTLAHTHTH